MTHEITGDLPEVHLEDVREELEPLAGMSVWQRMKLSYIDMRRTTRVLIEERPSEPRLLVFVLLSDVIFFLSRGVALVVAPSSVAQDNVPLEIGLWLVLVMLVRTALMYMFAAFVSVGGWLFGGKGSMRSVRTAVFWASLVAAPAGVFGALLGAGLAHLEPIFPVVATQLVSWPPLLLGPIAFIFFLSTATAEAHKFERSSPVFLVYSIIAILLFLMFVAFRVTILEALGLMG